MSMFQLEKEMIPILRKDMPKIFGSVYSAEEFVSGNGRPDLVFAKVFDDKRDWDGASPDYETIYFLIKFLNKKGQVIHVDQIFDTGFLNKKKIKVILEILIKQGFVEFKDVDHIVVKRKYRPVVKQFISIEAKLSDWKNGMYQAVRYKSFSNCSYLAISEQHLKKVDQKFLRANGIGLIAVSPKGASLIIQAKNGKPSSVISHYYLSEKLVNF